MHYKAIFTWESYIFIESKALEGVNSILPGLKVITSENGDMLLFFPTSNIEIFLNRPFDLIQNFGFKLNI